MRQIRTRLNISLLTWLGVAILVLSLTGVALGQAQTPKGKQPPEQKPVQGQQLCPASPGPQQCQVQVESPPSKPHGKTTCEATVDCPPAKGKKQP